MSRTGLIPTGIIPFDAYRALKSVYDNVKNILSGAAQEEALYELYLKAKKESPELASYMLERDSSLLRMKELEMKERSKGWLDKLLGSENWPFALGGLIVLAVIILIGSRK